MPRGDLGATVPARRTLTDHEDRTIGRLADALDKQETVFSFGGLAECSADCLVYRAASDEVRTLDFASESSIAAAFEIASASLHGRGDETVYDENVRKAREIKSDRLFLPEALYSLASKAASPILSTITTTTALEGIRTQLDKVNIYAEGGFFSDHRDTPKGDDHIGTLLIALPFNYEGGILSVRHDDRQVKHDWHEAQPGKLHWSFLFADTLHEVLPVTAGHRVTLSFHVFASAPNAKPAPLDMSANTVSSAPFYLDIVEVLADSTFLPEGGKVAIPFSHKYPVAKAGSSSFSGLFRGSDRLLVQALKEAGIKYEIVAIYKPNTMIDNDERKLRFPWPKSSSSEPPSWPQDGRDSWIGGRLPSWKQGNLRISTMLRGLNQGGFVRGDYYRDDSSDLLDERKMVLDRSLIWLRYPDRKTYSDGLAYVAYGNEARTDYCYVTIGVVATIPPYADRASSYAQSPQSV